MRHSEPVKCSGAGNLPASLLKYNPYAVLAYLETTTPNADQNAIAVKDGYPAYTGGTPAEALSSTSVQHVDRVNFAPFTSAAACESSVRTSDAEAILGGPKSRA